MKPFAGGLAQLARAPALQAGGQRFESVILHFAARLPRLFFDILIKQKKKRHETRLIIEVQLKYASAAMRRIGEKVKKGVRRMPWLLQAMKDVISCDKPRLGANGR